MSDLERLRLFADFTGADARRDPNWKPPELVGEGLIAESEDGTRVSGFWPITPIQQRRYEEIAPMAGTVGYPDGNPKTAAGAKKPDLSVVPQIGIIHLATAMMNGAAKYGPYNWREKSISTRPYVAAAQRHLAAFLDGEDFSADTTEAGLPVHHLAHVMACCAILLDAESLGQLNDNRPVPGKTGEAIERYSKEQKL